MCCFAQPVESVGRTRIFARLSGKGTQFVVYQMEYKSATKNAMILPIPTRAGVTEDALNYVNLEKYDRFFDDLGRAFPAPTPPTSKFTRSGAIASNVLAVHKVGAFTASFVPKQKDFSRLDPKFVITPEVWAKIPKYKDYSFVVFQLDELSGKPHPMAFEFPTRLKDQLFFPTVHIHDGEVHDIEDFDHTLFCQHAAFDNVVGGYTRKKDWRTGFVRSKQAAGNSVDIAKAQGTVAKDLLIHRQTMRGRLKNQDILARAGGDPLKLSGLPQWLMTPALGLAMATLPLGWMIHRRNKVSGVSNA